jgi:hypothetical protein
MTEKLVYGKDATFANIVLQLRDGTTKIYEPKEGQNILLMTQDDNVTDEDGNNSLIVAHICDQAAADLILRVIENSPTMIPLVLAGIMAMSIKQLAEMTNAPKGGTSH